MAKLEAKELTEGIYTLSFYVPDKVKWAKLVAKIKMIPDRRYVPPVYPKKFGVWECTSTPRNDELLRSLGFKLLRLEKKEPEREKVIVNLPTAWKDIELKGVTNLARPYQIQGIKQMVAWDCNLLQAFDMGLGKSLMSVSAMNHLNKFPVLIICPATLKMNWQREIDLWSDKPRSSYIVEGTTVKEDYSKYEYIIVNYDVLWHNLEFILDKVRPLVCIFDEAHVLKNGGSFVSKYYPDYKVKKNEHVIQVGDKRQVYSLPPKRVRASQWLVNGLPEEFEERLGKKWEGVKHTLLLTGKPIQNNNSDLFNLLHLLNPKQFVNKQNFVSYFCKTEEGFKAGSTKIVGSKNNDVLHKILLEKYMIRKLKDEVLSELPPLTKSVIPLPLEPSYRKAYGQVDEDFLSWINDFKSRGELSPEQERLERNSRFRTLLDLARDGKLESCFQYIDNIVIILRLKSYCSHTTGKLSMLYQKGMVRNVWSYMEEPP